MSNELLIRVFIFIFLVILETILDASYDTIDTISGKILNVLHHIFAVFLFFPFIIKIPRLHLFVMFLTMISWLVLKGCVFTMITDKCNVSVQKNKFQNFRYHIRKWVINKTKLHYGIMTEVFVLVVLGLSYNIYLIQNE
jgi:hypothetical protein